MTATLTPPGSSRTSSSSSAPRRRTGAPLRVRRAGRRAPPRRAARSAGRGWQSRRPRDRWCRRTHAASARPRAPGVGRAARAVDAGPALFPGPVRLRMAQQDQGPSTLASLLARLVLPVDLARRSRGSTASCPGGRFDRSGAITVCSRLSGSRTPTGPVATTDQDQVAGVALGQRLATEVRRSDPLPDEHQHHP